MLEPCILCRCSRTSLLLLVLLLAAAPLGCHGGSRRRPRRGSRNRGNTNSRKGDEEREQMHKKSRSKLGLALQRCSERAPIPPEKFGSDLSSQEVMLPAEQWRYLQLPRDQSQLSNGTRLEEVEWTQERETLCRRLFAGEAPPSRSAKGQSITACVLTSSQDGDDVEALFVVDYNMERGIPNFVAFVLPGRSNETMELPLATQEPGLAATALDDIYAPGVLEPCCWCIGESSGNPGADGGRPSVECGADAAAIGHLVPLSALGSAHAAAADIFLNTAPMRQPFLNKQWSQKLQEVFDRTQFIGRKTGRKLHVLIGPSLQTDGRLSRARSSTPLEVARASSSRTVDVPSFFWTAYADPFAIAVGGHFCRNGGPDDDCACVDGLTSLNIESRIGFRLFPGMHPAPAEMSAHGQGRSGFPFLWVCSIFLIFLGLVIFSMVMSPSKGMKTTAEKNRIASLLAKQEAAAGEKSMRRELESRAGGKEALRARFRAV